MQKPKSIQQFIEEHPEQKQVIIDALKLYDACKKWDNENTCAICDRQITVDDYSGRHVMTKYDYLVTCKEHAKYRNSFQTNLIREQLQIPRKNYLSQY